VFVSKLRFSFTVTNYNKFSGRVYFFFRLMFNPERKEEVRSGSEMSCRQPGTPLSSMDASEEPNDALLSGCSRLILVKTLISVEKKTN